MNLLNDFRDFVPGSLLIVLDVVQANNEGPIALMWQETNVAILNILIDGGYISIEGRSVTMLNGDVISIPLSSPILPDQVDSLLPLMTITAAGEELRAAALAALVEHQRIIREKVLNGEP